jgi:hypothetical protein
MIEQTKNMLALFKDGKLHVVIESKGCTTFYDPAQYTHVEGDTLAAVIVGKVKPTPKEVRDAFHTKTDEEIITFCSSIGI